MTRRGVAVRTAAFLLLATLTAFAAGCEKKPGSQSGPEGGGSTGDPDLDRLQGVWALEKYEAGDPITAPPEAVQKTMRYSFRGNKLRTEGSSVAGSFGSSYSVVLDSASNPKVMIVTPRDENDKPLAGGTKMEWIYKLDGDALVLAKTSGKRPKEFTAKPPSGQLPELGEKSDSYVPGVDVVRLKKTKEAPPKP